MKSSKAESRQTAVPMRKPLIVLVACPYNDQDYMIREDIAIDDLGLGYLYSALTKKGFSVELIDSLRATSSFVSPYEELRQRLLSIRPKYVGFSDSSVTFSKSLSLSRSLKEACPEITLIYGDLHASLFGEDILTNEPHINYVIQGEGETSFPRLIEALENGEEIANVPGLVYREGNEIKKNPPYFETDLDSLPFPHRPSLADVDLKNRYYYNIISSRGCPGHCTFCSMNTFLHRHRQQCVELWRARSAENVLAEMRYLYHRGIRDFLFYDDNWIGTRKTGLERIITLCEMIIDYRLKNISFCAMVRPDSLRSTDTEAFQLMKIAGLTMISMGLDAGNKKQLGMFGKNFNLSEIKKLVASLFENRIMVRTGFIMFYPYSTFEMLRENARFLHDVGLSFLFENYTGALTAFSATAIEKRIKEDNLLIKPTTYDSIGRYRFRDKRVENLQRFLLSVFLPERQTSYELLILASEASRHSTTKRNYLLEFKRSLNTIADSTTDFFNFCLDAFESVEEREAIRICYSRSGRWSETIKKEKAFFARFREKFTATR